VHNRSSSIVVVVAAATAVLSVASQDAHADATAGQKLFAANCADCHEKSEFRGIPAKELAATVRAMAAGTRPHEAPIPLNDEQIADVVTFFASGRK
jgi:cytochrome c553